MENKTRIRPIIDKNSEITRTNKVTRHCFFSYNRHYLGPCCCHGHELFQIIREYSGITIHFMKLSIINKNTVNIISLALFKINYLKNIVAICKNRK